MALRRQHVRRIGSCVASAAVLLGVFATGAQAGVTPGHVTVGQLQAALPSAGQVPRLSFKLRPQVRVKGVFVVPCLTNNPFPAELHLPGSRDVTVNYDGPDVGPNSPQSIGWLVDLVSTPSPAAARSAMARIDAAEKACPLTIADGNPPTVETRTLVRKENSGGWTGYVTVTKLVFLDEWVLQTILTRGNVIVALNQYVPDLPGSGPRQQAWRKASTKILLTRLAHVVP